jgi:hypothetical protein
MAPASRRRSCEYPVLNCVPHVPGDAWSPSWPANLDCADLSTEDCAGPFRSNRRIGAGPRHCTISIHRWGPWRGGLVYRPYQFTTCAARPAETKSEVTVQNGSVIPNRERRLPPPGILTGTPAAPRLHRGLDFCALRAAAKAPGRRVRDQRETRAGFPAERGLRL